MMNNNDEGCITIVIVVLVVAILVLMVMAVETQKRRLAQYDDTIAEYMMCIEYNSDCDCSDIILSEYGEEVE